MPTTMLEYLPQENRYLLRERLGLEHLPQVVELPVPPALAGAQQIRLTDAVSGRPVPCQRSRQTPDRLLAFLALQPGQTLRLCPEAAAAQPGTMSEEIFSGVLLRQWENGLELRCGRAGLRLPPEGLQEAEELLREGCGIFPAGPVRGISCDGGASWQGRSFLDSHLSVTGARAEILEDGALRCRVQVTTAYSDGGFYRAEFTLEAGQPFVRVCEDYSVHEGAQVVLDFAGPEVPRTAFLLDASPAYRSLWLHYGLDRQIAALGAWSQQSQLALSDGYAFAASGGIFGCFTMEGGGWRGNRLNALEAWVRRWRGGDPLTRRLVRAEAKADGCYHAEPIPGRDRCACTEHLSLEGWLGCGSREWGLLACAETDFIPPAGDDRSPEPPAELSHFEDRLPREEYQTRQGLLRRLHIRHGVFPLQKQLSLCLDWPEEPCAPQSAARRLQALLEPLGWAHLGRESAEDAAAWRAERFDAAALLVNMQHYLRVRRESFWYGAGIISTNPVSSRRIAPLMFLYEYLTGRALLPAPEAQQLRAEFSFFAELFASNNYYPGDSAMLPPDSPDSLDPTLLGMANQNFYTDVYNIPGTLAQLFPGHPRSGHWREHFRRQLSRQMQVHVYPASGVWEESHTYYQHVLHTLLPLLLRRRDDGVEDRFADPQFRRFLAAALEQRTPADELYAGRRHLVPFGDHDGEPAHWAHLWGALAQALQPHDAPLAQRFAWFADATSGGRLRAEGVPEQAMPAASRHLQGLGVFLRSSHAKYGETLFALRSGAAWGHHHNDDGSLWLYAFGRPLIADSACAEVQAAGMKTSGTGHSRWLPADKTVQNYLWRFSRGWVTAQDLSAAYPWAVGFSPAVLQGLQEGRPVALEQPLRHWRAVLQLSPVAYLLFDRTVEPVNAELHFHLPAQTLRQEEDREQSWLAGYDRGEMLRLQALTGIGASARLGQNAPQKPEKARLTTHHLVFHGTSGTNTTSVILLAAEKREGAPQPAVYAESIAHPTGRNWRITGLPVALQLEQTDDRGFTLTGGAVRQQILLDGAYERIPDTGA